MIENTKIGFLGSLGSYSHQAASFLRPKSEYVGYSNFDALVRATEAAEIDEAVLPLENSSSGRIPDVHRLIVSMELFVVEELLLDIDHCLISSGPVVEEDISSALSHPQGFIQTSDFLDARFPNIQRKTRSDTATAVKEVMESGDPHTAAIGSEFAAKFYSGTVLHKRISNRTDNITRFILLQRKPIMNEENNMTSLIIQVHHEPNSLVKALIALGDNGVNITKLETYMISEQTQLPTFYLDIGSGSHDPKLVSAMQDLQPFITYSKFLGSYKADNRRSGDNGFLRP